MRNENVFGESEELNIDHELFLPVTNRSLQRLGVAFRRTRLALPRFTYIEIYTPGFKLKGP